MIRLLKIVTVIGMLECIVEIVYSVFVIVLSTNVINSSNGTVTRLLLSSNTLPT